MMYLKIRKDINTMLRLGGAVELVSWLVVWFLFFLVIEGETPLDVEAKLKGALGWEVPWLWPVGRFLSGCSDPDSGRRTLFKLQGFRDEKIDPSRRSKMMLKTHNLGRYLKWIGKQTDWRTCTAERHPWKPEF